MEKLKDYLTKEFLEWQYKRGEPAKVKEFAEYIGVKPTTYSNWINSDSQPSAEHIRKISDRLGDGIYLVLGMVPPQTEEQIGELISLFPLEQRDVVRQAILDTLQHALDARETDADRLTITLLENLLKNLTPKS